MSVPVRDPRQYYDLGHQGDYDRTQLEAMLKLSPTERLRRHAIWKSLGGRNCMDPQFIEDICQRLHTNQVEYVIVGGISAWLHGSPRNTEDFDICYRRTPENVRRLVAALAPLQPRPRGFPPDLPFVFDERTIQLGSNFTLDVCGRSLDLLGVMSAIGDYEQVIGRAEDMKVADVIPVKVLSLADLIATKEAANRPKDHLALVEIRPLLEKKRNQSGSDG